MRDPLSGTTQSFRLSYGDCDTVGIAYFAIYYPWMERTYSSWLYDNGIRAGQLSEELGVYVVGVHSEATYLRQVTVFDELTCEVRRERVGGSSYTLGFTFHRGDELVTTGTMTFACRDLEHRKTPVPERIAKLLHTLEPMPHS
ncbi:thioesterase [Prauserella flavalba]|uniref:Thioesterase n=1 Tax=Prauserella flavalba TaxID=1477506 RepID=A0A318LN94_9PSEU|nr:thioesterase [Prauserella flavalba]